MTNAELLDLMREARESIAQDFDSGPAGRRTLLDLLKRIDAALAEHADSATPVVESVVWRNTPDGEDAVVNNAVLSVWGWRGGWAWQRKPLAEPSYLNRTESGLSTTLDEAKSAAIAAARGMK